MQDKQFKCKRCGENVDVEFYIQKYNCCPDCATDKFDDEIYMLKHPQFTFYYTQFLPQYDVSEAFEKAVQAARYYLDRIKEVENERKVAIDLSYKRFQRKSQYETKKVTEHDDDEATTPQTECQYDDGDEKWIIIKQNKGLIIMFATVILVLVILALLLVMAGGHE